MSDTPEEQELLQDIMSSDAYRLAYEDMDLLKDPDLRPLRFQLEMLKPERILREQGIESTVVVFGSARTKSAAAADAQLGELEATGADEASLRLARRRVQQAHYYEQARRFARLISTDFQQRKPGSFVVVTGGGPGIMEAANRGAHEASARSIGLNITLPHEQAPNPYISPELAFRFHYFALRKMHFLLRARALVAFPGGYGTMDELFEVLTLIQTRKMHRIPVVLVGREFWQKVFDFEFLVEEGYIAAQDTELFSLADTAEEIIEALEFFYRENLR